MNRLVPAPERLLDELAYRLGRVELSAPRHLDVDTVAGRAHLHYVGDRWEVRVAWHRHTE
jgi:hypothetical protein